jgi:hypothetical protein
MRTRHSLTAAVVALVVILVGIILSLLAGGGPNAHADGPATAPSLTRPTPSSDPGTTVEHRHDANAKRTKTTGVSAHKASPTQGRSTVSAHEASPKHGTSTVSAHKASPTRTTSAVSAPKPPKLGHAKAPAGATYQVSGDGRAFTTVYSSLESGTEIGRLSRTQSVTVPVTGDADDTTLSVALQGYVLTGDDTTATLTVTVNGAATTRTYHAGADRSFTESVDVPLRGVRQCRITVRVEVDGADGYLNASALDGRLG